MRVKRYVVSELPEAISMIRSELGKDAVILNTKEIRVGGFMGMFRKRKMEVLAAVETGGGAANRPPAPAKPAPPAPASAFAAAAHQNTLQDEERIPPVERATGTPVMEAPVPDEPAVVPTKPQIVRQTAVQPNDRRTTEDLFEELKGIKQYIVQMSKRQETMEVGLQEAFQALYDRLIDQEVERELAERLITSIREKHADRELVMGRDEVWEAARQELTEWLAIYPVAPIGEGVRVVHFVGPTGVGKTTTIAKLAAEQTIKQGKQLGFITSDTYRIAAIDQLRTYASILNIPMEVVFSPMDLPKAFLQLEDRELIFMDTAGRNFRSELHVSEVNSLLHAGESSDTVLVFSMTGKTRDMLQVAEHFMKFGVSKVLFTKLDETGVYGAILNLIIILGLNPTYVASGQTVPDDIEKFSPERYIESLLGEPTHE